MSEQVSRARQHARYRDNWETPVSFVTPLIREFGLQIDLAASSNSWKLPQWLGPEHPNPERRDALAMRWHELGVCGGWLNPPYGRGIDKWVRKAYEESCRGFLTVALLPANTDTAWFHDWVLGRTELRFVRGRIQFEVDGRRPAKTGNTGGSVVAIYRPFGRSW